MGAPDAPQRLRRHAEYCKWKDPAPFVGQGDKIIIRTQWIVPVWHHRNISLGDYLGNS
jgi:hypothetical protein